MREQYSTLIKHLCVWTSLCACTHTVGFFQFCSQFKVPFYSLLVVWRKHTGKYEDKKIFLWATAYTLLCYVFKHIMVHTHNIISYNLRFGSSSTLQCCSFYRSKCHLYKVDTLKLIQIAVQGTTALHI